MLRSTLSSAKRAPKAVFAPALTATGSATRAYSTHKFRVTADPGAGSNSAEFLAPQEPFIAPTYVRPSQVFVRGKGSLMWDLEGRRYVDFTAGIAVTALGHANQDIAMIMYIQGQKLIHTSNLYYNLWTGALSKALVEQTKASGGMHDCSKAFLANSGTEANEAALKLARKWGTLRDNSGEKYEIIAFKHSFHGRSMGALSVTTNPKYQKPFAPLIPGIKTAELNNIESVKAVISSKTCGVILEPIQGEGGIFEASVEFLTELKQLCESNDALLIYDEIQCGLGRSGKLWAHSYLPPAAHPDVVSAAKALGNGFPIGTTLYNEKLAKVLQPGDHGTTYGGNPLGSRIGHYVLSQISQKEFLDDVQKKSARFLAKLTKIQEEFPDKIVDVRGKGLLLGMQFKDSPDSVIGEARKRGLLIITAGNNTIRFVPALNIEDELIDEGLDIFRESVEAALNK